MKRTWKKNVYIFSSVQLTSHVRLFETHGLNTRPPCPSSPPSTCSNSRPYSQWCHPIISSSVVPFSSWLQSFPASGSFSMSQFFASDGQSIGASASVLYVFIYICIYVCIYIYQFRSVQSLSCVRLFATPWISARQASLSITNSQSLLKLISSWVGDAIQLSHPLSSPSPPDFNLSQHQGLFKWARSLLQVAKILEFQL